MECTCSDNLYGRIGYCPVHEAPRVTLRDRGIDLWSYITIFAVFGFGGTAFLLVSWGFYKWVRG